MTGAGGHRRVGVFDRLVHHVSLDHQFDLGRGDAGDVGQHLLDQRLETCGHELDDHGVGCGHHELVGAHLDQRQRGEPRVVGRLRYLAAQVG